MSRYTVEIGGDEWIVEIDGDRARVADLEVRLATSALPGELILESEERCLKVVPQPGSRSGTISVLAGGRYVEGRVVSDKERLRSLCRPPGTASGPVEMRTEIPGVIREVLRRKGETFAKGEALLTLEAMKMENEVRADFGGRVVSLHVKPGQKVEAGELLAVVQAD